MYSTEINFENYSETNKPIDIQKYLSKLNLEELIEDSSVSANDKTQFILKMSPEEQNYLVEYLSSMIMTIPTQAVIDLAKELSNSLTNFQNKTNIVKGLHEYYEDKKDIQGLKYCEQCFFDLYKNNRKNGNYHFLIRTEILIELCNSLTYSNEVMSYLEEIAFDDNIDCQYRYRFICSLLNSNKILNYYSTNLFMKFVKQGLLSSKTIPSEIIIMSMINVLTSNKFNKENKLEIIKIGKSLLIENTSNSIKAEVADMLLMDTVKTLDNTVEELSSKVLMDLGRKNISSSLYSNKENVHNIKINQSVRSYLRKICNKNPNERSNCSQSDIRYTFLQVKQKVNKFVETLSLTQLDLEKINSSLYRIELDRFLYESQYLSNIFIRIYQLIEEEKDNIIKTTLMNRMIEELIEMSKTCSSGHVLRLVNIVSGFYFQMDIGFKNQIQANLFQKFNKMIQEKANFQDVDGEYDIYIDELSLSATERNKFNDLIIKKLPKIKEEMYKEFVDGNYLKENEFEEYFVSSYNEYMNQ